MQRYRSGHNEAVLKTVCPQGHMGSNPILSAQVYLIDKPLYMDMNQLLWRSTQVAEGARLESE